MVARRFKLFTREMRNLTWASQHVGANTHTNTHTWSIPRNERGDSYEIVTREQVVGEKWFEKVGLSPESVIS